MQAGLWTPYSKPATHAPMTDTLTIRRPDDWRRTEETHLIHLALN